MSLNNKSFSKIVENAFEKQFKSFFLPTENYHILLGLSGGADSTALLFLLHKFGKKFGYTLHAIHINHMIRNDEADRDEEFCRELCKQLSVEFYCVQLNVPNIAKKQKIGLEEAARNVRYFEFAKQAKALSENAPCFIATAHNADDNAETVIFNLIRGSSLKGLSGIKSKRSNIIRPILNLTKAEIIGYCNENGIKYITDSTNSDNGYSRNKIRNLVIPQLKTINPSLCKVITRATDNFSDIDDFMLSKANEFITLNCNQDGLDIIKFNSEHVALKKYILSSYIKNLTDLNLEDVHINDIIRICNNNIQHSSVDFGNGFSAEVLSNRLILSQKHRKMPEEYDLPLFFGINHIPSGVIGVFRNDDSDKIAEFINIYKKSIQTAIKSDRIDSALRVRSHMAGDVYNINGVNRKVKKLLNEICPDLYKRAVLPLIYDELGIIWIPGARSATNTYPKNREKSIIFIYSYID